MIKGLPVRMNHVTTYFYLVPGAGIEPAQPQGPRDFKSLASTSSATQASFMMREIYMLSGNRCQEIHSPPRYGGMTGLEKVSPANRFHRDLLMEFSRNLCKRSTFAEG